MKISVMICLAFCLWIGFITFVVVTADDAWAPIVISKADPIKLWPDIKDQPACDVPRAYLPRYCYEARRGKRDGVLVYTDPGDPML